MRWNFFYTGKVSTRSKGLPKLILLDLKAPKVNGSRSPYCQSWSADESGPGVVMLTSSAEERDVVERRQLGVNNYLANRVDFR